MRKDGPVSTLDATQTGFVITNGDTSSQVCAAWNERAAVLDLNGSVRTCTLNGTELSKMASDRASKRKQTKRRHKGVQVEQPVLQLPIMPPSSASSPIAYGDGVETEKKPRVAPRGVATVDFFI